MKNIEIEYKFKVNNINDLLQQLKQGKQPKIFYVKDEIWGKEKDKSKIRKRTIIGNINKVIIEKTTPIKNKGVNKKLEETLKKIPSGWKCENSYNKIRWEYQRDSCVIAIDFYSIGVFCEIEGQEKYINLMAKKLRFNIKDNIKDNIDLVFVNSWKKNSKIEAPLHWGF